MRLESVDSPYWAEPRREYGRQHGQPRGSKVPGSGKEGPVRCVMQTLQDSAWCLALPFRIQVKVTAPYSLTG